MPDRIIGYYGARKDKLLRDFDRTCVLMKPSLVARYREEFAPYVCMSDIALSEGMGWSLIRTQTLADGCPHCDFRFKDGAATRISSKTPEVQETIERIRKKEFGENTTGGPGN